MQQELGRNREATDGAVGDNPRPHEKALREGMWRGHGGYEIALSPVILGGFGWLLDSVIGTVPIFLIVGAVLGLVGSVANQYYRYQAAMEIETAKRLERHGRVGEGVPSVPRSFGRVERAEIDTKIDFSVDPSTITGQASS